MSLARLAVQNSIMSCFKFKNLDSGRTMTINDLSEVITDVTPRTIQRAVDDLVKDGHLYPVGKKGKAVLYGTSVAAKLAGNRFNILYHVGGELVDLPTFVLRLLNVKEDAFTFGHTQGPIVKPELKNIIRMAVATAILSSEDDKLALTRERAKVKIGEIRDELHDLLNFMNALEASDIFKVYKQDMLREDLKELIKKHPNLYTTLKTIAQNRNPSG